jgi:hypothetical protein
MLSYGRHKALDLTAMYFPSSRDRTCCDSMVTLRHGNKTVVDNSFPIHVEHSASLRQDLLLIAGTSSKGYCYAVCQSVYFTTMVKGF